MTTDLELSLVLLWLTLCISAILNVGLVASLLPAWHVARRDHLNGAKTTLLRGMLRRRWIHIALHAALLVIFGIPVFLHHGAPLPVRLVVTLVVVLSLIADAVSDAFTYRLLRALLHEHGPE